MAGSGGSPTPTIPYVTDGLVFWLDGIEKGNNAGAWTDLVGGKVYTNQGATQESDGWTTSANGYLVCQENLVYPTTTTTLEICYSFSGSPQNIACLFTTAPSNTDSWAFGFWNATLLVSSNNRYCFSNLNKSNNTNTFAISSTFGCQNYLPFSRSNALDYWGNTAYSYIGRRSGGNVYPFNGKIHSIRIYNRVLSWGEIAHNEGIDNSRFNLGIVSPQIQRVEYLESNGAPYINTGIIPNSQTGISIVASAGSTLDTYIVGCRNSAQTDTRWAIGSDSRTFYGGYGVQVIPPTSLLPTKARATINYLNDGMFVVEDAEDSTISSSLQLPPLSFTPYYGIVLFGGIAQERTYNWKGKLYECTITQGSNIIRHFVPVRVGSVGYMYDEINGVLYGNNSTGSFTYGNDIN